MDEDSEFVQVEGLDKLAAQLDAMPYKFAGRIQRVALQAGGEVFAAAERELCPVAPKASHKDSAPGELRDSIQVKVRLGKDLDESTAKIGPGYSGKGTKDPGVYVKFVEQGTFKMDAEPFMRPAFSQAKETAQEAYTGVVSALLHEITDLQGE
jgi:HK97 gp10 family phage protein